MVPLNELSESSQAPGTTLVEKKSQEKENMRNPDRVQPDQVKRGGLILPTADARRSHVSRRQGREPKTKNKRDRNSHVQGKRPRSPR